MSLKMNKAQKPTHLTINFNDDAHGKDHSPALSQKIKVPQREYSSQEDPLRRMATPIFDKHEQENRKKGPSSAATVLALSGLFVVGTTLILSGIIVLIVQQEPVFVVTGCLFLGVGVAMLLVCVALQRKNLVKFVLDINRDLYFLNMSKSSMFKTMFEMNTELPLSHAD
ncbi:hypothetical protein L5515_007597 [Caenorhabditis briggsae]|uniref:Uncharacterized protein n=2 Tax=Caenorhabditis briggsae TaxID=6238 RepID=A0AAE9A065_CAEBR|nr:hypothetical protein L3Y34_007759 [Caenorhabditis briggsae]UMM34591.1 hypothetical protein L5515_007597 [Caenorhabditis briggsae]